MAEYSFNEGEYRKIFERMFGNGSFARGMSEAENIGYLEARAKIEEQLYMERLRAAEAAARARRGGGRRGGGGGGSTSGSSNSLIKEFRSAQRNSQLSPAELYTKEQAKEQSRKTGLSVMRVQPVPIAQNTKLPAYNRVNIVKQDAKWVADQRKKQQQAQKLQF